jgi:hypothetical protein
VPDSLKSAGQDMQQETANELIGIQAHHLLTRIMAVILPMKADLTIDEIDQAMIGNSHPMRIATQILKDLLRASKRWFGVNHPLDLSYWSQIPGKGFGTLKWFKGVKKVQLPDVKGILQLFQKQSAKQPRQMSVTLRWIASETRKPAA